MNGLPLFIDWNSTKKVATNHRIKIENSVFVYQAPSTTTKVDTGTIRDIINFVNAIRAKYSGIPLPIEFRLGNVQFVDKLIITLFECICQYIMVHHKKDVRLVMHAGNHIHSDGIWSSPLLLLTSPKIDTRKKYPQKFQLELYNNHYRRVFSAQDVINTSCLSRTFDDLVSFQLIFDIAESDRESIAEIVVELVGNACEHTHSDCLLDIDITRNYFKANTEGNYFGINICIVDFSEQLFNSAVSSKILNAEGVPLKPRYEYVKQAYLNHQSFFSSAYTSNDFFTIAAFQHKISGRISNNMTGGTGLTKLVKGLQLRSDSHNCYMESGLRRLKFSPKYLEYNEDDWIGFNTANNFLNAPPDASLFKDTKVYIPGTAYNLTFVMKKGN